MFNFIAGFVCGVIIATVGFAGVAKSLDTGVDSIKKFSTQIEQKK